MVWNLSAEKWRYGSACLASQGTETLRWKRRTGQRFRRLYSKGWRCCSKGRSRRAMRHTWQNGHRSEPARGDRQQQPKPLEDPEQRNTGTGNHQDNHKHAVRTEMPEIVQVIVAFPKRIDHQKRQKNKQQQCNDALLPREHSCKLRSIGSYPLHRQRYPSRQRHLAAICDCSGDSGKIHKSDGDFVTG